jgi:beta-lactamase regulating signal transducer with metallopeptidase domain
LFRKDGNPFNTSIIIAPSAQPPATSAPPSFSGAPNASKNHTNSSSPSDSGSNNKNLSPSSPSKKTNISTLKIIGYVLVGVVSFIVLVLTVIFCLSKIQERRSRDNEISLAKAQVSRMHGRVNPPIIRDPPVKPNNEVKKG